MKICFLEGDMSRRGGTERITAMLANALCEDNDVFIYSLRLEDKVVYYSLDNRVHHEVLKNKDNKAKIHNHIRQIHSIVKEKHIDWIINVDVGMGFYGILAAKGTSARVITWEHANFYNNWNSRIFPYLRRFAAKHSDVMVVLTEMDKRNYEINIRNHAPVYVIPNPAVTHDFNYDINSKIILSAGLLLPIKGYDKAIEVAKNVLPECPEWKWIICGDGSERNHLQKLIEDADLSEQMLLLGNIENMDEQYQKAAMFVMTSEMEGLPMVLLEAKSWGLPLLSFDIMTGPSDIIADGANGYLVPAGDIKSMSDKITLMIEDKGLRKSFSAKSQKDMDKFLFDTIIEKWKELLKQ